ncbi:Kelch-like protein 10 [Zootermopsis nevadensis]|uniref:Kelch-like protein 10 n=2 Tax=Zootermopsis nevadensis TaxID=136037 RepID=A0A067R9D4_ZOONE|nr:Kelch-like protein 10 [Zootermopsis nevadensis]
MPSSRSNMALQVIDDIFAIGGFNSETSICQMECFDHRRNEWYEVADMNTHRTELSACVVKGLPNAKDYIYKHRDMLLEEERQKILKKIGSLKV